MEYSGVERWQTIDAYRQELIYTEPANAALKWWGITQPTLLLIG